MPILAFAAVVCGVSVALQRRFERVLAPALCGLMLLLYALAIPRALLWIDGISAAALATVAAGLIYALARRRISMRGLWRRVVQNVFTPGALCFVCLCALFVYASGPMVVWWTDDAGYWALEVKSLWYFNGLVGAQEHLALAFGTYLPGMQLLQWWVMHAMGTWSEPALYATLFISYAAFLLPLLDGVSWRQWWAIPLMLAGMLAFPVWGNAFSYTILSVDTVLALCFGYALARIWRLRPHDRAGLWAVGLALCAMTLLKQTGVLFAAFAIIWLLALKRERGGHGGWAMGLCCATPFVLLGSWMLFCRLAGISGMHTSSLLDTVREILGGNYVPPPDAAEIAPDMLRAMLAPLTDTGRFSDRLLSGSASLLPLPLGARLLLLIALPLCMVRRYGRQACIRASAYAAGMTILYTLILYAGFFTVFRTDYNLYVQQEPANMTLLLERYFAPLVLGMGMLDVAWGIGLAAKAQSRAERTASAVMGTAFAALLAFTVNWGVIAENLVPERYIQYDEAMGIEGETYMDHSWAEALTGYEHARVLVGLEPNNSFVGMLNYTFAPARFAAPLPSELESSEALTARLLDDGITHVIYFDEGNALYESGLPLAQDGEWWSWTLYEVIPDGLGGVSLVEFY